MIVSHHGIGQGGWALMAHREIGSALKMYRDALEGLALSRGLVAAYEQRVAQTRSVVAEQLGIARPEAELPKLGLQIVELPVDAGEPLEQHPLECRVESLARNILPQ